MTFEPGKYINKACQKVTIRYKFHGNWLRGDFDGHTSATWEIENGQAKYKHYVSKNGVGTWEGNQDFDLLERDTSV